MSPNEVVCDRGEHRDDDVPDQSLRPAESSLPFGGVGALIRLRPCRQFAPRSPVTGEGLARHWRERCAGVRQTQG